MTLINSIGVHFLLNTCRSHCSPSVAAEFKPPYHRYQIRRLVCYLTMFEIRKIAKFMWYIILYKSIEQNIIPCKPERNYTEFRVRWSRYNNTDVCGWTVGPGKRESRKTCTAVSSGGGGLECTCIYNI